MLKPIPPKVHQKLFSYCEKEMPAIMSWGSWYSIKVLPVTPRFRHWIAVQRHATTKVRGSLQETHGTSLLGSSFPGVHVLFIYIFMGNMMTNDEKWLRLGAMATILGKPPRSTELGNLGDLSAEKKVAPLTGGPLINISSNSRTFPHL